VADAAAERGGVPVSGRSMDLTVAVVVVAFVAVLAGALVQGVIGFGMNLVAVPVLALVEPDALPAVAVMLGVPLSLTMLAHEHTSVDRRGVAWVLVGRVPGTVLGAWIVTVASNGALSVVIGVSVLLATVLSAWAPPVPHTRATVAAAGVVSGTTGTAAGIGGPPLALLYQHHAGPVIRSTLAATFFLGTILSLALLGVAGEIGWGHLLFAVLLTPAALVGGRFSRRFARHVDAHWLRPAVLVFAAVSAVVVIANGVA
jgi:uncharacterized membrane protein YfcA